MLRYVKIGFIAGAFDLIHPGYIEMFREAKANCDQLFVAIHRDPTLERDSKLSPVLSLEDRILILNSIKYIDAVVPYDTEEDLYNILVRVKPHVRFLGNDYIGKPYTGEDLNIPIKYLNRSHGWSTTKLKTLIHQQIEQKRYDSNLSLL